jgi:hypothetical protein
MHEMGTDTSVKWETLDRAFFLGNSQALGRQSGSGEFNLLLNFQTAEEVNILLSTLFSTISPIPV